MNKKNIIISGPSGSGKNWISMAIAATHEKVINTTAQQVKDRIEQGFPSNLSEQYSLMIIDDCTAEDIAEMDLILGKFPMVDHWSNEFKDEDQLPIIYLTQDEVTNQSLGNSHFHVIHCRNAHL
ncbi:P-loop NTPase family protein [Marinoscillum furvescens]|uniref:AAA domain-containing protein n=1 Tax=Marinoscillum furvescens DSM 4134 TaxID=1122208 RepID=A0A3D9L611_MARFU|nr:hypothetical protein [Marinoscillum furvescens]REE01126.1 hypothetical protein C7460_104146 [Marinoscillum furvescens DSM 4134]